MVVPPVVVDAEYSKEIDKARQNLRALISSWHCGPELLRLAWLDALSYDVNSNTDGPNSLIRNEKEYFCLNNAVDLCEKIKYKHQKVTYADLYQTKLVSCAVKGDKSQLRDIFFHMGLSDKDVVTLSGARHLMATSKTADRSSYVGLWTEDQLKFDNSYFMKLLKRESEGSKLHPVDQYLLDDPVFHPYIELYAEYGDIFFRDYAVSHKRLSELGFTPSSTGCLVKKLK